MIGEVETLAGNGGRVYGRTVVKMGIGGSGFCSLLSCSGCVLSEEEELSESDGVGSMSSLVERSIGGGGSTFDSALSLFFPRRKWRGGLSLFLRLRLSTER